jgi:hypothetical protein
MIKESARCEHGGHWLLCQYCGEQNRDEVGECLGKNGAQALVDVRTLDGWAEEHEEATPPVPVFHRYMGKGVWAIAFGGAVMRCDTPEAARALAAAWVREQAKGAKP